MNLTNVETKKDEIFGLDIPLHVPGVPDDVLQPNQTWEDQELYTEKAKELAKKFRENFKKFSNVSSEIIENGGPIL